MSAAEPVNSRRRRYAWYGLYLAVVVALMLGIHAAGQRVDYNWHWERVPQYVVSFDGEEVTAPFDGFVALQDEGRAIRSGISAGPLAWGLWLTLKLSALSLLFALILGLVAGLGRVADNPAARGLAATYVEIIRGTPLLVQIFIFYFFVGTVMDLSAFTAGVKVCSGDSVRVESPNSEVSCA